MFRTFFWALAVSVFALGMTLGYCIKPASAGDYKVDKEICEAYAKSFYDLADLRNKYTLTAMTKAVLKEADKERYTSDETVALLRMIYQVYSFPASTPEQFSKEANKSCMKGRGHIKS